MFKPAVRSLEGLTFLDLFAGLGGFRLALESYGARCVWSSEWDKQAQDVYEANFGERPNGDITKIKASDVPDHDIVCAGFPCQAFSVSGKMRGFEDARGTLFFDVARIVREKRPKAVFMENVRNFAVHDGGKTLAVVKATMEELGYSFHWAVLNAADFGIPQKRERIYMVCFRKDLGVDDKFSFPKPFSLERHVEDFLQYDYEIPERLFIERGDMKLVDKIPETTSNRTVRVGIVGKGGQGERIYSTKGLAVTFSAYGGGIFSKTGGYLVDGRARKLSPRECARLMGFPDDYKMSRRENQAYQQFGNSVVVDVLQYIAGKIGEAISQD